MKEIKNLLEYIKHMSDEDLQKVERILRLIYMSQQEECKGAKQTFNFKFDTCEIGVFYVRD